ncbi:hypothetical protein ABIG06_000635 [Bradyrhizobium sp. USDA 326]
MDYDLAPQRDFRERLAVALEKGQRRCSGSTSAASTIGHHFAVSTF